MRGSVVLVDFAEIQRHRPEGLTLETVRPSDTGYGVLGASRVITLASVVLVVDFKQHKFKAVKYRFIQGPHELIFNMEELENFLLAHDYVAAMSFNRGLIVTEEDIWRNIPAFGTGRLKAEDIPYVPPVVFRAFEQKDSGESAQ